MDIERATNKVLRDLIMSGVINPDDSGKARIYLNALFVAGMEQGVKGIQAKRVRRVEQYNMRGEKIGEFLSIRDAARAAGYGKRYRGGELIVQNVLAGRHPHSKEGYIWKYAELTKKVS